ncbi:hypothetical protein GUJ93_ZPchr0003g16820 [Zizania palustris]|uniref:Uncharacterized protein n=1 Tax=Zizania palustris TaxID=103762 RepID=A0A8J5SIB9_ZIZPA|nr:hypothetical protein GUJ93_ZPchr0003g16820 [Zizania palustris]
MASSATCATEGVPSHFVSAVEVPEEVGWPWGGAWEEPKGAGAGGEGPCGGGREIHFLFSNKGIDNFTLEPRLPTIGRHRPPQSDAGRHPLRATVGCGPPSIACPFRRELPLGAGHLSAASHRRVWAAFCREPPYAVRRRQV